MPPESPTSTPKLPPAGVARAVERVRHHVGRLYQRLAPLPITVVDMIFGAFLSQAISAAAQLGIADALAAGPLTKEELARGVGADPDSVARLMRLLISRGVFRRRRDGRFAHNALSDTLRTDSPISMRGVALIPDHDREFLGHYADMEMLVMAGALERGHKQWTDLLRRGGFRLQRVVQTAGPLCVIEAVPS